MQVDTATLMNIQEFRVEADPIIASDHATAAASLDEVIYAERRALLRDTPTGERIPVPTWGELATLCSVASLTHAAFTNERFVRLMQLALRETLDVMAGDTQDTKAMLPSNFPVLPANDETRERARGLREALKRDRDRWFTEHVDDLDIETDGVPTAFWLHDSTRTAAELLAEWYADGDVSERLLQSLPTLPGQTPGLEPETPENTNSETGSPDDPAQAGLDMF